MLSRVGAAEAALYHEEPGGEEEPSLLARLWTLIQTALPKGAVIISVMTLGGAAADYLTRRILTHTFGAGPEYDAFIAAFKIPELALQLLVFGGVIGPFLPLYLGLEEEARETAREFARTVMTLAALAMGITAAILFVLAPHTVSLVAPGFSAEQRDWYTEMFRLLCVAQVIASVALVLGEVLVAERRWITYGAYEGLYFAGIGGAVVVLGPFLGIQAAAIGAIGGASLGLAVRLFGVLRTGFAVRPSLSLRVKGLGDYLRLAAPKMVSQPLPFLMSLFFVSLASTLTPGAITDLDQAQRFQSLPETLIGVAFATAAFPALSAAANAGDRRAFKRALTTNFLTIGFFSLCAAVGLIIFGNLIITVLFKGGAFDQTDVDQTAMIVMILAISIPLESLTELFARAIYATHNTTWPMVAAMAGFAAGIICALELSPALGLAAIPIGYVFAMGTKLAILAAVLQPRTAQIGAASRWSRALVRDRWGSVTPRRQVSPARVGLMAMSVVVLISGMAFAGTQALSRASLADPVTTPWAPAASLRTIDLPTIAPTPTAAPSLPLIDPSPEANASGAIASETPAVPATPTPTPGIFAMDLYQEGDFVGELKDTWCVPAAMQTSINIMSVTPDTTRDTQAKLFDLAVSIAGSTYGGADPSGWATGLQQLGYGKYSVGAASTMDDAVKTVVKAIRLTGRPAGLLVWRGWHSWVVSGFTASVDPATTDNFQVLSLRIEDVWYPRVSTLWNQSRGGMSRPPDSDVPVKDLKVDYLPWNQGKSIPGRDHKYVFVLPMA
jgi:putative peptidoglycan lipid II flippase